MWTLLSNDNINRYFEQYPSLGQFATELVLREGQGCVFLPRYFIYNFPSQLLTFKTDVNWIPRTVNIELKDGFELRVNQFDICRTLVNIINSPQTVGGIVKARPGAGKTIMAIYAAAITKRKTLIIIDNSNLAEQWTKAICNCTNVTEDQIGLIQASKFDVNEDTPFTICLVQTLMSKVKTQIKEFYEKIKACGFDLVFFDECHQTTCGPKYATATLFLNTTNIFGLSATPFADTFHEILMHNALGNIVAQDDDYELIPKINFVYYNSGLDVKYGKQFKYFTDMIKRRAVYVSKLDQSSRYGEIILQLVKELRQNGHKIIIIVFTVALVKYLHEILTCNGIQSRQFYSQQRDIDKDNDDVIIATYKYAGAGFDMPSLSAAILGTPLSGKKSLIQVIGRILRSLQGKQNPVVYDLIETGFEGLFANEVPRKKAILHNEFNCKFSDVVL